MQTPTISGSSLVVAGTGPNANGDHHFGRTSKSDTFFLLAMDTLLGETLADQYRTGM